MNAHTTDPLAAPGVIRILLSEAASAVLSEAGSDCFAIVARASYPADHRRMVIYLRPVDHATAQAACGVLAGTHAARRIKAKPTLAPQP